MENGPGLVFEPEKAWSGIKKRISDQSHRKAISFGEDVPEQEPLFKFPINKAGISNKTLWIKLPQGRLTFNASIHVSLPEHTRGIHMSRIEAAISELYETEFKDIREYAIMLADLVGTHQKGDSVKITLSGMLPHLSRTVYSQKVSVDSVKVFADISSSKTNEVKEQIVNYGLEACHITSCPCTQLYNSAISEEKNGRINALPTHSQRSLTEITLEDNELQFSFNDLFKCLTTSLHVTSDLLKRSDEAEIVIASHESPQFAEDAVREVAKQAGLMFGKKLPLKNRVRVRSRSLESIHIHDVTCEINSTLGEIVEKLK